MAHHVERAQAMHIAMVLGSAGKLAQVRAPGGGPSAVAAIGRGAALQPILGTSRSAPNARHSEKLRPLSGSVALCGDGMLNLQPLPPSSCTQRGFDLDSRLLVALTVAASCERYCALLRAGDQDGAAANDKVRAARQGPTHATPVLATHDLGCHLP